MLWKLSATPSQLRIAIAQAPWAKVDWTSGTDPRNRKQRGVPIAHEVAVQTVPRRSEVPVGSTCRDREP